MPGRLEGKVAIVTGATSGIGARTAELFVEEGARVVIAGRTIEKGERLAERLGSGAVFVRTDVAREADIEAMVGSAIEHFGRLDCLFNNAGMAGPEESIAQISWDGYTEAMNVLLGGVLMGMKHAARVMEPQGCGSIINNASIAGLRAGYADHIYTAAKAAVIHLTRSVAMELGEAGIRVNSLSPGLILTPIFGKAIGLSPSAADASVDKQDETFRKLQPIRRSGKTDDVASAALFLASDEASFINGHDLVVDGGLIGGSGWSDAAQATAQLAKILGAP